MPCSRPTRRRTRSCGGSLSERAIASSGLGPQPNRPSDGQSHGAARQRSCLNSYARWRPDRPRTLRHLHRRLLARPARHLPRARDEPGARRLGLPSGQCEISQGYPTCGHGDRPFGGRAPRGRGASASHTNRRRSHAVLVVAFQSGVDARSMPNASLRGRTGTAAAAARPATPAASAAPARGAAKRQA